MGWLDTIQIMLTENKAKLNGKRPLEKAGPTPPDPNLLEPAALGQIIAIMLSGGEVKSLFKTGGLSALAALLWGKYKGFKQSLSSRNLNLADFPALPGGRTLGCFNKTGQSCLNSPGQAPEAVVYDLDSRMARLIRAIIFAARSGEQINTQEYQVIDAQLQQLKVGPQARKTVQEAMEQSVEPALVANGLAGHQEAVELYLISCSVLDINELETNAYLAALAGTLKITDSLKKELESEINQKVRATIRRF